MKRKGNLINKLCSLDNIIYADITARKNKKKSRKYINIHDKHLLEEDIKIQKKLFNGIYKTSQYDRFELFQKKLRLIYKLPYYPDRIVHHAIMNVVKDLWTKQFILNTYSCIEGRGIHKCLCDLKRDLRKTRFNGATTYCLKFDITKFYPSIDHNILKKLLAKKIKDKKFLDILYEIVDSINYAYTTEKTGVGVPIGNYLSQFFANLYLSPLDHWCKEELRCRYYYRYADDIVILSDSKEKLRTIFIAIKLYLSEMLNLKVKSNFQIFPVESRGIDFVGYVFKHNYIKVRKYIKNRCRQKIKNKHLNKIQLILPSYFGWFKHCNAVNLKQSIINKLRIKYNINDKYNKESSIKNNRKHRCRKLKYHRERSI